MPSIDRLLRTAHKLLDTMDSGDPLRDELSDMFTRPPKRALLTMEAVLRVAAGGTPVRVVEPQEYGRVTLLDGTNYMFESFDPQALEVSIEVYAGKVHVRNGRVGYFHTGLSGIAHAGDGGDFGDVYWRANGALKRHLRRVVRALDDHLDE